MLGACSNPNEAADELRSFVTRSAREPRVYEFRSASAEQVYTVRATVEDELRYGMVLSQGGRDLLDYIVHDDALAVRVRDAEFAGRIANVLGDPVVDSALREGRWVIDPSGAPPLIRTEAASAVQADPFEEAQGSVRFITQAMGQASEVKEFTLEDIEYRSALDPWRYPGDDGEARYDLIRPALPTSEAATLGAQGDIGPAQFRKTSVFVEDERISEICSLVDVQGHEEFLDLRRRGDESNPFVAALRERIERKQTAVPIEERYVHVDIDYPDQTSVALPADATVGKLETFMTALEGAFGAGLLRPSGRPDTDDCRRPAEVDEQVTR